MDKALVIGVAGGTGSGKTTFTQSLAERLGGGVAVLSHDSYYRSRSGLTLEERSKLNFDHPDAYETDLMVRDLTNLRQGRTIQVPVYDFSIHDRLRRTKELRPAPVIIVEGILILHTPELRDLMDAKVFVYADADVRILRRAMRDVEKRGRTLESVVDQYLLTVKPMHEKYVETTKRYADIIVPSNGNASLAADMLASWVRERLAENMR